jgi:Fibronectin type III domain
MSQFSVVQTAVSGGAGLTPVNSCQTAALSSAVTTGNTLLVSILGYIDTTAATMTITDSESNVYTCDLLNAYNAGSSNVISNPASNAVPANVSYTGIWRASNVTGGSNLKVTATLSGSVTGLFAIAVGEISGILATSPVDGTPTANAGASGNPSASSFSTSYPTDFIFMSLCGTGGSGGASFTVPSGYSSFAGNETGASLAVDGGVAYLGVTAVQSSVNPTWTTTNFTNWVTATVAYKAYLIVQSTTQASGSGVNSVQTAAFGSAVTTGDTVLVQVMGDSFSASATVTITDTESNTYTCDLLNVYNAGASDIISNPTSTNVPATSTNPFIAVFRASNVTGGASFKVTVTLGGGATGKLYLAATEFTGLGSSPTIDSSSYGAASTGSPAITSFSTTNATDLMVLAFCGAGSALQIPAITSPSGYIALPLAELAEGVPCGNALYSIVSTTQSGITPTWTTSHITDCVAIALAYKIAASGTSPGQVTGLTVGGDATNPTTALDLSWSAPTTGTTPFTYTILQASTIGGTYTQIASGVSGTTYTNSSLTEGTEYAYKVEAVNAYGTGTASTAAAYATAPTAPTGLSLTPNVNPNEFSASYGAYSPNSNIQLAVNPYIIRWETPPGSGNWQNSGSAGTTYNSGALLTPGSQYGVEVSVIIASANSDWSGTVQGPWSSEVTMVTYPVPRDTLRQQSVMRSCTW